MIAGKCSGGLFELHLSWNLRISASPAPFSRHRSQTGILGGRSTCAKYAKVQKISLGNIRLALRFKQNTRRGRLAEDKS